MTLKKIIFNIKICKVGDVNIMTKNESKYRTRIIQEWYLRKSAQRLLDRYITERRLSYERYYHDNVQIYRNKVIWHNLFLIVKLAINQFVMEINKTIKTIESFTERARTALGIN